jgi:hypothetical protein
MKHLKKILIAAIISLLVLIVLAIVPIPFSQQIANCCDQFAAQASYGFPFAFRAVYGGGFTGLGQATFSASGLLFDFGIFFVIAWIIVELVTQTKKKK